MAKAGYCSICKDHVWLDASGCCMKGGHGAASISAHYDAESGQTPCATSCVDVPDGAKHEVHSKDEGRVVRPVPGMRQWLTGALLVVLAVVSGFVVIGTVAGGGSSRDTVVTRVDEVDGEAVTPTVASSDLDAQAEEILSRMSALDEKLEWDKKTPKYDRSVLKKLLLFLLQPAYVVKDSPSGDGKVPGVYEASTEHTNWEVLTRYADGAVIDDPATWGLAGLELGHPDDDVTKTVALLDVYFRHGHQEGTGSTRAVLDDGQTYAIGGTLDLSDSPTLDGVTAGEGSLLDEILLRDCPRLTSITAYSVNDARAAQIVATEARALMQLQLPEELQMGRGILVDISGCQFDQDYADQGLVYANINTISQDSPSYAEIQRLNTWDEIHGAQ